MLVLELLAVPFVVSATAWLVEKLCLRPGASRESPGTSGDHVFAAGLAKAESFQHAATGSGRV